MNARISSKVRANGQGRGLRYIHSDVITEYLHQTDESIHESAVRRQEYLEKIMREFGTAPDEGQADGNG